MLDNIFKKPEDDEKKQMAQGMQSMSDQMAALGRQLVEKNAQIDSLRQATSSAQSNASALADAKKQMEALQDQIRELQRKLAEGQAANVIEKQQGRAATSAVTAPAASTPPAAAPGLAVGSSAWVTREGGLPLRLRSGAGLGHEVLDRLPPGTQMTLLEGPRQGDNYSWWRVRTVEGQEGWVAGQDLRAQPD